MERGSRSEFDMGAGESITDAKEFKRFDVDMNSSRGNSSEESFGRSRVRVSSASGYLCHIKSETLLPCPPHIVFAVLSNPDNTSVFRDIKARGSRKVIEDKPEGYKVVEVEQIGEIKVLWKAHQFSTFLTVIEDSRDGGFKTTFELIKSDVLSKFQGTWALYPGPLSMQGNTPTTRAILEQDVLPIVRRLVEDLEAVIQKIQAGTPVEIILPQQNDIYRLKTDQTAPQLSAHAVDLESSDTESGDEDSAQAASKLNRPIA